MSLEKLKDWVGRSQTIQDLAAPFPVRALAATFDADDSEPKNGDPLPPLWHWLYFLDSAPQSKIGADGHAERGDFLPPVPLPRRMWAGSRFSFDGEPVRVGDTIGRTSEIKSVEPKSGSTGSMVFVTVKHTIFGPRGSPRPPGRRRPMPHGPGRSCLIRSCCFASPPLLSTAIASTTTSPMSPALRAIPA